jgi:hypothetical protein
VPIHPAHFSRIDRRIRQRIFLEHGYGEDLHLDVARVDHRLFEGHCRVAECQLGLPAGRFDGLAQRRRVADCSSGTQKVSAAGTTATVNRLL